MTTLRLAPDELLTQTRTVRKRLDLTRPVPMDLIRECLEIALQAPSGANRQRWQWVVIRDPDLRKQIGEIYLERAQNYAASDTYVSKLYADDPARS
jgi:nitroreductase